MKLTSINSALLAVFVSFSTTHATPPHEGRPKGHANSKPLPIYRQGVMNSHHGGNLFSDFLRMRKELTLTGEQIKELKSINRQYRDKIESAHDDLEENLMELHDILQEKEINLGKVRKKLEKISPLRIDILILKIDHRLKVEKVLTEEQKAALKKLNERHRKRQARHR